MESFHKCHWWLAINNHSHSVVMVHFKSISGWFIFGYFVSFCFGVFCWTNKGIISGQWVFSDSFQYLRPQAHSIKQGKGSKWAREKTETQRRNSLWSQGWSGQGSTQQLHHFPKCPWLCSQCHHPSRPHRTQEILTHHRWPISQS